MGRWFVALLFLVLLGLPTRALAETYVAAGIGMNAPSFDTTDAGKVALQKDLFYGGKIGHYFNDRGYNWFGIEVDAYRSTPGIKQQTLPTSSNPRLSGPIPTFVSPSREIPAVAGLRFGVRTMSLVREYPEVTITITHPPMGPEGITQQSYVTWIPLWTKIDGYLLEFDRDLVPGDWTISAAEGEVPLFAVHFTLVDPAEMSGMDGVCRAAFVSYGGS